MTPAAQMPLPPGMTIAEVRQRVVPQLFAHYRAEAFKRNHVELTDTDAELEEQFGAAIDEILSRMLTDYVLRKAATA